MALGMRFWGADLRLQIEFIAISSVSHAGGQVETSAVSMLLWPICKAVRCYISRGADMGQDGDWGREAAGRRAPGEAAIGATCGLT